MSLFVRVTTTAASTTAGVDPTRNTALIGADGFNSAERRRGTEDTGSLAQTTGGNTGSRGLTTGGNTGGRGGSTGATPATPATPVTRSARAHGTFPPGQVIRTAERT